MSLLIVAGTLGFVAIEGWSIADSLYMTIVTVSTVGYGETNELTPRGRAFASSLISVSIVLMACWTAGVTSFLVSGQLSGKFYLRTIKKRMSRMNEHVIVCGGGAAARTLIHQLQTQRKQIAVIASDPAELAMLRQCYPDLSLIDAEPKSEMAMFDANVLQASHLVAATESDFDNLLIIITGKSLGTDLQVISLAKSPDLASRMFKVGADDVVCPLVIGGEHVASLIADSHEPSARKMPVGTNSNG
ncbi:MAG: NAD-binding protein [Planctomycetota bacterium]